MHMMQEIEFLKPGDPCPCCGKPIKLTDRHSLLILTWFKAAKEGNYIAANYLSSKIKEFTV